MALTGIQNVMESLELCVDISDKCIIGRSVCKEVAHFVDRQEVGVGAKVVEITRWVRCGDMVTESRTGSDR